MLKTTCCAWLLTCASFCAQAQGTVLDSYNQLAKVSEAFAMYPLTPKGDKWETNSTADYTINATVDVKNGYIQVKDEGTGGGSIELELALFRTAANQDVIVAARTDFDGIGYSQEVFVYQKKDGEWQSRALESVFPDIHYTDFSDNDLIYDESNNMYATLLLDVPQYGTTAKYSLAKQRLQELCSGAEDRENDDNCLLLKALNYSTIEVKWDKTAQYFVMGAKK